MENLGILGHDLQLFQRADEVELFSALQCFRRQPQPLADFRGWVGFRNHWLALILTAHQFEKCLFRYDANASATLAQFLGGFQFDANPAIRQQRPAAHAHNQQRSFSGNSH